MSTEHCTLQSWHCKI